MSKERNGISAFWNLTNTLLVVAFLTVAGLLSYLAISTRANAAEISATRAKAEVNEAVIDIVGEGIPEMRRQLAAIDKRLYRLEVHFKTLPEAK